MPRGQSPAAMPGLSLCLFYGKLPLGVFLAAQLCALVPLCRSRFARKCERLLRPGAYAALKRHSRLPLPPLGIARQLDLARRIHTPAKIPRPDNRLLSSPAIPHRPAPRRTPRALRSSRPDCAAPATHIKLTIEKDRQRNANIHCAPPLPRRISSSHGRPTGGRVFPASPSRTTDRVVFSALHRRVYYMVKSCAKQARICAP